MHRLLARQLARFPAIEEKDRAALEPLLHAVEEAYVNADAGRLSLVLVGLINILGVLACCVGVLFTITTGFGAMMFAYETIFSDRKPQGS